MNIRNSTLRRDMHTLSSFSRNQSRDNGRLPSLYQFIFRIIDGSPYAMLVAAKNCGVNHLKLQRKGKKDSNDARVALSARDTVRGDLFMPGLLR